MAGKWGNLFLRSIGFLLLAYFLSQSDFFKIFEALKNIEIFWLVVAVLIKFLIWLGRSFKWRMINLILGVNAGIRQLLIATAGTDFWAQISPARVGEIVKVGYFPSVEEKWKIISSLFIDRFFDVVALLVLGVLSFVIIYYQSSLGMGIAPLIYSLGALGFVIAFMILCHSKRFNEIIIGFSHRRGIPLIFSRLLTGVSDILSHILSLKTGDYFRIFSFSLILLAVIYFRAYLVLKALSIDIPLVFFCLMITTNFLIQILPITVMGIGTRDFVFIYGFSFLGFGAELALSFSFLFLAVRTADLIISYVFWVLWPPDLSGLREI
ncbi:hypothetical protein UR09_05265 [Candidatus Nitromaritima sp. SCGC AAA799-A02]|nr:hypothetical protein UR09_05265 [Candidatus Nitromaritima sp. SCGC AAA799-A02]